MKIQVMNELLSNKIAAGEVVEQCSSVVKELVENSIDAKATDIRIDLVESGIREIKVTDNGLGMDKTDAVRCFERHATSKILNEDDLFHISTLGFRGEALPSIASVSQVILKTCNNEVGTIVKINGGMVEEVTNGDARVGTSITISNLFYNTPARLKHLSSLYTELSNITQYIEKIALSHPNIKFVLTNDNKILLNTDGSNNLLKVINNIYGIEVTKKMLHITGNNDDYQIEGYISYPEINRSNRNHLVIIVNGRVVRNNDINRIINDAYHTYKPENRYPIVIMNINVDGSLIDVNIHPTKMDIKFSKIEELKDLLFMIIRDKLNEVLLIPEIKEKHDEVNQYEEQILNIERNIILENTPKYNEEITLDLNINEEKNNVVPELYPVGVVHGTYIVCENEQGMYLIDQHAANERINYEKYLVKLGEPKKNITDLLIPYNIELPINEYIILKQNIEVLTSIGITVEESGVNSISIKAHPTWFPKGYEITSIKKIIDIVLNIEKKFNVEKFNEKIAITLACKLSIKANQNISIKEMENLIDNLRKCNNPWTCPHGRPTIIYYSIYELEKMFKRSV